MALKVFVSSSSLSQLEEILEYINSVWGNKSAANFANEFINCINKIEQAPQAFPVIIKNKNVHRCVITRHNSMFYRIKENEIEVVFLFDNRQSLSKLKTQLKRIK